jgi:hypothetical protein
MVQPKLLGTYLASRRSRSGAKSITDYLRDKSLSISETFYRALENGDKNPTVNTVEDLAQALDADRFELYQYYLQDLLPADVFDKLIRPVIGTLPKGTAKDALELQEEKLQAHRLSLQKQLTQASHVYLATDDMVDYLTEHFRLLPIVHAIYMKADSISEGELLGICKANAVSEDLGQVLEKFDKLRIAQVEKQKLDGRLRYVVRRFNKSFRLPPTDKGRQLRRLWAEYENRRALNDNWTEQVQPEGTFLLARIDCFRNDQLPKIQERVLDLVAELNAASEDAEKRETSSFFASIVLSPRPEYTSGVNKRSAKRAASFHG